MKRTIYTQLHQGQDQFFLKLPYHVIYQNKAFFKLILNNFPCKIDEQVH